MTVRILQRLNPRVGRVLATWGLDDQEPEAEEEDDESLNAAFARDVEAEEEQPTEQQLDEGERMEAVERRAERATNCMLLIFNKVAMDTAQDFVNVWTAFGQFCRTKIGIEPETMMKAWLFPMAGDVKLILKRYPDVKADPVKVEEYASLICGGWDRRFGEI